jgi:hypothetical protein
MSNFEIVPYTNSYRIYNEDKSELIELICAENHVAIHFGVQTSGHCYDITCHGNYWLGSLIRDQEFCEIYCEGDFTKVEKYKNTIAKLTRLHYSCFR